MKTPILTDSSFTQIRKIAAKPWPAAKPEVQALATVSSACIKLLEAMDVAERVVPSFDGVQYLRNCADTYESNINGLVGMML